MAELVLPLTLVITPAFYQAPWFAVLCALLSLSALYFLYQLRLQYITSRLKQRLKDRSSERIRIARELHDTLLQSVHGLMLRFHFATEALPENEPARASLQAALSRADEVIVEARHRVQDLREETPEEEDFAAGVATIGQELELHKLMEFRVIEDGDRRELRPEVRSELCKIAREALTNILHHSHASSAEVMLYYSRRDFIMKCSDNGVGLAPAVLRRGKREGHWGLVGIRERIDALSGRFQLWSSPDGGTEVEVRVPGNRAYAYPSRISRWLHRSSRATAQGVVRRLSRF